MNGILGGRTPDITAVQISAILKWLVAQIVAWGYIDNDQGQILVSGGTTIVAAAWVIADAFLRGKRAQALLGQSNSGAVPDTTA